MEVLQPEPEQTPVQTNSGIPQDFLDAGIDFKNVQFLDHLGLKDQMFNPEVMDKIIFISSKVEDLDSLMDIDMRLGNDGSIPRVDKLYSYLKLVEQSDRMKEKQSLIDEQLKQYGTSK